MRTVDMSDTPQVVTGGHTSKGDQPKWELDGVWYKADRMGHEALSEVLVSAMLAKSNITDFVVYEPVQIQIQNGVLRGCVSKTFLSEQETLIPFERLHRLMVGRGLAEYLSHMSTTEEKIRYTVGFLEKTTGIVGAGERLTALLELDSLVLNEDRHTNNLAVIQNDNTGAFRFCPVFDNGLAFLADEYDYPETTDVYGCISRVKAKPFSTDFDEQAFCAAGIYGSQLKLSFGLDDLEQVLNGLGEMYPETILQRVETVVMEQMRKYRGIYLC